MWEAAIKEEKAEFLVRVQGKRESSGGGFEESWLEGSCQGPSRCSAAGSLVCWIITPFVQILPEHLVFSKWWVECRGEWYRLGPCPKEPRHLAGWEDWRAGTE